MTQCEMILDYMKTFGGITTLQAILDIGCTRLSARIADLKKEGHEIEDEFIQVMNRYHKTVHVKRYFLPVQKEGQLCLDILV